ncbi:hypothetical protein AB6T38_05910 [Aliiglaciecola sp. SL4]|uniref:hypothetical protein n=1 Tax=Aliiglaciecola sp. SL4 TaxID=3239806 RepID=UPI00355AF38A
MNKLNLSHQYTPDNLDSVNKQLETVLSSDELDDKLLRQLIIQRDEIVTKHISSLDKNTEKLFSTSELEANQRLSTIIEAQLKDSLKQLTGLIRGKKIVDKYK